MARSDLIDVPFRSRAQVRLAADGLLSTNELVSRANKKMMREFSAEELFFWPAEISNNQTDSHFTKMHETSLANYAEDANSEDGVAFLDSHNHGQNGLGRSLTGLYDKPAERVLAQFYTVRGLQLGRLSADNFIRGVESGIVGDVSIGFKAGPGFAMLCSECGEDIRTWDCRHLPGQVIEAHTNEQGDITPEHTVIAWVMNARLSEVSAVYDGSTPSAMILKAQRGLQEGFCKSSAVMALERRYNIHIPPPAKLFTGYDTLEREIMPEEIKDALVTVEDRVTALELRNAVNELGLEIPTEATATQMVRLLVEKVRTLVPQAKVGVELRARLVEEAIKEGIRALGDKFDAEKQRALLTQLDVENVDTMREAWAGIAAMTFKGGRETTDELEEKRYSMPVSTSYLTDAAFGG